MSLAELQLARLVRGLRAALGANLAGAYLHGSLALGGFEPAHSDIDVLVVVHRSLSPSMRTSMAELLLDVSAAPHPVELSVITVAEASVARHPLPYELHYSEAHREAYRNGTTALNQPSATGDSDLAAHVLVVRRRSRVLHGPIAATYLPEPSRATVADSLLRDLTWARDALPAEPHKLARYLVLNAVRAIAWARDDIVLSKQEGAAQAARYVDARWLPMIEAAAGGEIAASVELEALLERAQLCLEVALQRRLRA